ncbi:MAG: hypothetical protein Fur0022_18020 [Anaerolineales bacterium]
MSEPYDPKLFVGREEALKQIEQWLATAHPSRRIFSLTGPPGIGKSWVIAEVYRKLYAAKRRVFILNLNATPLLADADDAYPDFVKIKGPVNAQQQQKYRDWLKTAIKEAKKNNCLNVEKLDLTLTPERSLEKLVEALCRDCADPAPVLIVDGYEGLSPEEGDWLQEYFLKPVLTRQCSLLIITRRDEKWLEMSSMRLITSEDALMLQPLSEAHGKEQIQKRLAHKSPALNPSVLQAVYNSIPRYKQTHPKINSVLMDLAIEKEKAGQPGTLTYQDMQNCIRNFTLPLNISDDARSKLEKLAKVFPGEFSLHELFDHMQINLNDLQELFELGLLQNGISKHTIPEGIYELAKAMANLAP